MSEEQVNSLERSHEFDTPAEHVWALLEDFGNIQAWWPDDGPVEIERIELIGSGIGMVRNIYNVGMSGCISERLDYLDPNDHTLTLSIIGDRPGGLTYYQATGKLQNLGEGRCRLIYRGEYTVEPGREVEAEQLLITVYDLMFTGLGRAVAR